MVVVRISGGLGNQLFQYAFGQYVAEKIKTNVLYDIQTELNMANFTSRDFALSNFNLKLDRASKKDIRSMRFFSSCNLQRFERKVVQMYPFINTKYYIEKNFQSVFLQDVKDNCYYDGYWQLYKYLDTIESLLKTQIVLNDGFLKEYADLTKQISNSQSVSIHIRRGDYISIKANANMFITCGLDYYYSAINYVHSLFNDIKFYIFSDDIEWAKKHFVGNQFCFMEANEPFVDLYLMSLCRHNIIANSTFSWWGAWLNRNLHKVVISPNEWFVGKLNTCKNELIPQKWIQI